jgi:epoxyqueuosine reductase
VKSPAALPTTSPEFAEAVKEFARSLGFELVGITTPEPPAHLDIYEGWLARGCQGEMSYLASDRAVERRRDPRLLLPECRSIIVLGARYPSALVRSASVDGFRGKVAAYAWGSDYHEVLPVHMERLVAYMQDQAGITFAYRCTTDSAPLLERELAQRAGLGWIGKNTCLIHPQKGSFFLLAEILLGLELAPDSAFTADRCGACRRCLDTCPTECIQPDRTLDARRCLSYLTIELKGVIPPELRPSLGEWVFGCDICQQVCPWNARFAGPKIAQESAGLIAGLSARADVPAPNLTQELALDPDRFNQKFRHSALKRAKRRGYGRNVAVALGNLAAAGANPGLVQEAVTSLSRSLTCDPEPLVRSHAAWALGRIGNAAAREGLCQAEQDESDEAVLQEIHRALLR